LPTLGIDVIVYGLRRLAMDFKRDKALYAPGTTPSIIDVPPMSFLMVDGRGDPNTSAAYHEAVEILYALSYGIKMANKAIVEYVVGPLEGLWEVDEDGFRGGGEPVVDKGRLAWTAMIRQPDFVTAAVFEAARVAVGAKKRGVDLGRARLESLAEGWCVQAMHLGSYDDEPATIVAMERYARDQGYQIDMADGRRHHEIYLSDPRKVAVDKLRTVLRHPVRAR
jgi:hypothetical protein